jgi:hypothetical protein
VSLRRLWRIDMPASMETRASVLMSPASMVRQPLSTRHSCGCCCGCFRCLRLQRRQRYRTVFSPAGVSPQSLALVERPRKAFCIKERASGVDHFPEAPGKPLGLCIPPREPTRPMLQDAAASRGRVGVGPPASSLEMRETPGPVLASAHAVVPRPGRRLATRAGARPHPASVATERARRPAPPQEAASPAACADRLWPSRHPRRQPPRRTRGSAATGAGSGRAGAGNPATTGVP